jgi:phospholipase D1/2
MHANLRGQTILRPGHNVWRVERASRAAVLIDAAAYFDAVRRALLKAERRVFILGWDMHSQTRLVGEKGEPDDGLPAQFGDFLSALVKARPKLEIYLLAWDFAFLYATEREFLPRLKLGWNTPANVHFELDNAVPLGSSQHQKLIVVDDAVAFSGGLDVTIRRWDTSEHRVDNEQRVDPAGASYAPFHDVQMMVEGPAAHALAEITRTRWAQACDRELAPLDEALESDPWPDGLQPDFTDVDVGIARTHPAYAGEPAVREVEQLFLDSIEAAERAVYIENQFLTHIEFADRLCRRLKRKPNLEVLIVAPERAESWVEYRTMRPGRMHFTQTLCREGGERIRLVYPQVKAGSQTASTMVHSKVMVIDDIFLRVGSANLNNRSMGADTECDLVIEARSAGERASIRAVRDRLLADHTGVAEDKVREELRRGRSLLRAAERLSGKGHRLKEIEDGEPRAEEFATYLQTLADPQQPIAAELLNMFDTQLPRRRRPALIKVGVAALILLALTLAWHLTPLSEYANLDALRATLGSFSRTSYGALIAIGGFLIAGFIAFPITVLIAATAAAFGPIPGMIYSAVGAMASAVIVFGIGAAIGRKTLRDVLGPRLDKLQKQIARRGVIAVATIRILPLAPFTVINLAAGASEIRLLDFVLGTAIGLAPGIIVLSLLGGQIVDVLTEPTAFGVGLLLLAVAGWIGVTLGGQYLIVRYRKFK